VGRQRSGPATKWSGFEAVGSGEESDYRTWTALGPAKRHAKCGKRTLQDASADVTLPGGWQPVRMAGRSCLFICQPGFVAAKIPYSCM